MNSIRARKDLIFRWLRHRNNDLDILCFQEIKGVDEKFPYTDFEGLGYVCKVFGQKAYNGVAICSKLPLSKLRRGFADLQWDEQKRLILCQARNITLINVYAPHGGLRGTDKHRYKLEWYDKFRVFLEDTFTPDDKMLVMGDFNVVRADADVYDPDAVKDGIGTLVEEREAFTRILDWGLTDTFRHLYPTKRQYHLSGATGCRENPSCRVIGFKGLPGRHQHLFYKHGGPDQEAEERS